MSAPSLQVHASSAPTPEQKRELVDRVVTSETFRRAPAMCAFLLYITDHSIAGRSEKLKEQVIGTEVLGRRPDYDPAEDNIVRVRAHDLRGRLQKYFSSEGAEEPWVITIPRGHYAPVFEPRQRALPQIPATPQPDVDRAPSKPAQHIATRWWVFALAAAIVVTAGLARYAFRSDSSADEPAAAIRDFWGQFFARHNEELKVVYADASFALWQDLNKTTLDLGDYLSHKYLNVPGDRLTEVAARRATSPADMAISVHLASLASEFGGQIGPQYARNANTEFFRRGNLVLLGSRRSNPWVEAYESYLTFQLGQDPRTSAPLFKNRSPGPHEAAEYVIPAMLDAEGAEEKEFESYGVVALLRGCQDRGLTVLVEGLNMQATQAAGDFLTDSQLLSSLLRYMGHKPGTTVSPFEALVEMTSLPGGYDHPKVVAFRPIQTCVGD